MEREGEGPGLPGPSHLQIEDTKKDQRRGREGKGTEKGWGKGEGGRQGERSRREGSI